MPIYFEGAVVGAAVDAGAADVGAAVVDARADVVNVVGANVVAVQASRSGSLGPLKLVQLASEDP